MPVTAAFVMSQILQRTRLEIGDYSEGFWQTVTADGLSSRFELGVGVVDPTQLIINVGGSNVSSSNYTLDATKGVLTLASPPTAGTVIIASGNHWQFMNDTDLGLFVSSALLKHVWGFVISSPSVDTFGHHQLSHVQQGLVSLPPVEYHPVALLAASEALRAMAADAAYDIDVVTAEGTSLPRSERYQAIKDLAQSKEDQYKSICAQMNVGFWRARMGTLRRKSLRTGRLVPVYLNREIDDNSPPQRMLDHIDIEPPSLALPDSGAVSQDLVVPQGQGLSTSITTNVNLTTATSVTATVSTGNYTTSILDLTVTVVTPATGQINVVVPYALAQTLPAFAPWRVMATMADGTTPVIAYGTLAIEAAA